jgi:hypothetical protein
VTARVEGARFAVTTWRDAGAGGLWWARVVRVRPEAAPYTDPPDEDAAVVEGRQQLLDAVRAAVAQFLTPHRGEALVS